MVGNRRPSNFNHQAHDLDRQGLCHIKPPGPTHLPNISMCYPPSKGIAPLLLLAAGAVAKQG
jgi:hypothetical protein